MKIFHSQHRLLLLLLLFSLLLLFIAAAAAYFHGYVRDMLSRGPRDESALFSLSQNEREKRERGKAQCEFYRNSEEEEKRMS
jgi:hypothetical protein